MRIIYLLLIQIFLFIPINSYSQQVPKSGEELFLEKRCARCHTIGRGRFVGPDLYKSKESYSSEEIVKWAMNPQLIYQEKGKVPVNQGYPPMPPMNLSQNEAEKVKDYLISFKLKEGLSEKGTIKGTITNETTGKNAADVEIVLRSYLGDIEQGETFKKVDEYGKFNFSELDWNRSYELTVLYQQAQYTSNKMVFAPNEDVIDLQLPVFDSTESDVNISINNFHTIIYSGSKEKFISITNIYEFLNSQNTIFVGKKFQNEDSLRKTLVFNVPEDAKNVQFLNGLNPENVVQRGNQYFDTTAFNPGFKNVVLTYELPLKRTASSFNINPEYKVSNLIVLIKKDGVSAEVDGMGDALDVVIENDTFKKFERAEVIKGEKILVLLEGIFVLGDFKKYIPIAIFGIFILAGIVYSFFTSNQNLKNPDQSRKDLIREIARLDDLFELDGIKEPEYKIKREELKKKIIGLASKE